MEFISSTKENERKISEMELNFIFRHFIDDKESHVAVLQRG